MSRSDCIWYGRACVWLGVALLLVMAFTGAQVGFVSVIAVFATIVGIGLLLYAGPFNRSEDKPRAGTDV